MNSLAQKKYNYERDKSGLVITAGGIVLSTIALTVKDGGEYTYSNGYNSTKVIKPFYQCTNRVIMLGLSVTISITGLIYQYNNR